MISRFTTKTILIYDVIKLKFEIRLEHFKDCVCGLLQILKLGM